RVHDLSEKRNGWVRANKVGNYGNDYWARSIVSFAGLWANNSHEAVYFGAVGLDGSAVYTQTFPRGALPGDKARYFWSVVAVDGERFRVIPNMLERFLLNKQSGLRRRADGSLTLVYAAQLPEGYAEENWLPTPTGRLYNLTFRFYGPIEQ